MLIDWTLQRIASRANKGIIPFRFTTQTALRYNNTCHYFLKSTTRRLYHQTTTLTMTITDLEKICINTIRAVSADQPEAANAGHPGAPMGCAPMAYLLWAEFMKYSGKDSAWIDRDRFVLSNGHACALQYTMLHLTGYNVSKEDLSKFRQLGSITPGHPENFHTDGK